MGTLDDNHFANPVDAYVGQRVRDRRLRLGWTLMELATKLGVSHQQVQKYEQGTTRISAGALFQLSRIFQTNQDYFFLGLDAKVMPPLNFNPGDTIDVNVRRPLKIVLIEDDSSDELLMRRALDACDIRTKLHALHDGEIALQFLRRNEGHEHFPRPDLIILDLNLPKRDGHMLLKDIKRDRSIQDIPVVVMTNSLSKQEMLDVYRHGASGYVCKSFDFDIFTRHVRSVIAYWSQTVVLPNHC